MTFHDKHQTDLEHFKYIHLATVQKVNSSLYIGSTALRLTSNDHHFPKKADKDCKDNTTMPRCICNFSFILHVEPQTDLDIDLHMQLLLHSFSLCTQRQQCIWSDKLDLQAWVPWIFFQVITNGRSLEEVWKKFADQLGTEQYLMLIPRMQNSRNVRINHINRCEGFLTRGLIDSVRCSGRHDLYKTGSRAPYEGEIWQYAKHQLGQCINDLAKSGAKVIVIGILHQRPSDVMNEESYYVRNISLSWDILLKSRLYCSNGSLEELIMNGPIRVNAWELNPKWTTGSLSGLDCLQNTDQET